MSNAPVPEAGFGEPPALESFEAFYRRSYGDVLRLAWLLTGSRAGAEDVVQDAFSRLFVRFERVQLADAYLRRSVVNGAQNWQRNERRQRERSELVEALEHEEGPARELLAAALALPYRQRVVIIARYWGGWSESEIADAVGCRPGTVKSLAARALERLRKEFSV